MTYKQRYSQLLSFDIVFDKHISMSVETLDLVLPVLNLISQVFQGLAVTNDPLIQLMLLQLRKNVEVSWIVCLPLVKSMVQIRLYEFSSLGDKVEPVPVQLPSLYILSPPVKSLRLVVELLIIVLYPSYSLQHELALSRHLLFKSILNLLFIVSLLSQQILGIHQKNPIFKYFLSSRSLFLHFLGQTGQCSLLLPQLEVVSNLIVQVLQNSYAFRLFLLLLIDRPSPEFMQMLPSFPIKEPLKQLFYIRAGILLSSLESESFSSCE